MSATERFSHLARRAWRACLRQVEETAPDITRIGAFLGWGSLIYTAVRLATLWDDATLLDQAEAWREELASRLDDDVELDLLGGAAGAAVALARLAAARPSTRTVELARRCGERLLARAVPQPRGLGWLGPVARERPIPGLAHGASGFAWGLASVAALTGDDRFQVAALEALEFERGTFAPDGERWPALSSFGKEDPYADGDEDVFHAWCHGAGGMALGRVAVLAHQDDDVLRAELRHAARLLRETGFGHNHSLCHGDLGNLEALAEVGRVLGDGALHRSALKLAAAVLDGARSGWVCGVPMGVETPCLMTGLAGIGYQLLRLAAPEDVPSVLLLEV